MNSNIQILLVDDHQVVRNGLQHMLELEEDMSVVGEASDGESALSLAELLSPDIILMDIKMPGVDGIELTRQVKQKYPACNIIMLTLYDQYLTQAIEAGAKGYLLKDIEQEELTQAIRQVHCGEVVISEDIKSKTQFEYEDRRSKKSEEGPSPMVEEIQVVLPPPIEANQLMRFTGRVEEALHSRLLQVVGSWQEGTVMTVVLPIATSLADILDKLGNMPEIETVEEKLMTRQINPKLLKKAEDIPRLKNRARKTIFVTLEKGQTGGQAKQKDKELVIDKRP
ncbi:response regulator transcription factor [Chloroflexota bacterium]